MTSKKSNFRICFVCLGNICRSPLAHGVFEHLTAQAGLAEVIETHSAGTGDWHVGNPPDERMQATANRRGIRLNSRARQFIPGDLERFDLILAMDRSNLDNLRRMIPRDNPTLADKIVLFRSFDPEANNGHPDVPDPYYGGLDGFSDVFDIVARTCPRILSHIQSRLPRP